MCITSHQQVLKLPNLYMIQTVDSEKLANGIDAAWAKRQPEPTEPLRVLVQVNTSGEDGKSWLDERRTSLNNKHFYLVSM